MLMPRTTKGRINRGRVQIGKRDKQAAGEAPKDKGKGSTRLMWTGQLPGRETI